MTADIILLLYKEKKKGKPSGEQRRVGPKGKAFNRAGKKGVSRGNTVFHAGKRDLLRFGAAGERKGEIGKKKKRARATPLGQRGAGRRKAIRRGVLRT